MDVSIHKVTELHISERKTAHPRGEDHSWRVLTVHFLDYHGNMQAVTVALHALDGSDVTIYDRSE